MGNENPEVKIARMEERINTILSEIQQARDGRKAQYETLEEIIRQLIQVDHRISGVEQRLSSAQPTLDEFVDIKLKVQGAGIAGKWLWAVGSCVLTAAVTMRETIFAWLSK